MAITDMATIPTQPSTSEPASVTFVNSESPVTLVSIPASATTLAGFRQWALSDDFPERGKITFVNGELIVDMSPESFEKHSDIKTEISRVLSNLVREQNKGRLHIDGVLITNEAAGVSNEPDVVYLAKETLKSGRAKLTAVVDDPNSSRELVGTVDWVLEIVSPSSIKKDKVLLRDAYYQAGIGEYWIVDVLDDSISFQLLTPGDKGYEEAEATDGWLRSPTFDREFRLTREQEADGYWLFTLHMREVS